MLCIQTEEIHIDQLKWLSLLRHSVVTGHSWSKCGLGMGREYLFGVSGFRLEECSDYMAVCHFIWNNYSCSLPITVSKLLDDAFYQVVWKCSTKQATVMMCILEKEILRHREGMTFQGLEHVISLIMLSNIFIFKILFLIFFMLTESLRICLLFIDAPSFLSKILVPPTEEKFSLYEFLFIGPTPQVRILSKRQYSPTMEIRAGL